MQKSKRKIVGKKMVKEKFSKILNEKGECLTNSFTIYSHPAERLRRATANAIFWSIKN